MVAVLISRGYEVVGPTVRDGAIVYDRLASLSDLPVGLTDEQAGGRYRLSRREDGAFFGYVVGPQSWKRFLHPPFLTLWKAKRAAAGFELEPGANGEAAYALVGVRACELAAIAIQDRVMLGGPFGDPGYKRRREAAFLVAVNCGQAGGTCFCVSMKSGPRVSGGFDLALTEILEGEHRFLVEVGSERGAEIAAELPTRPASEPDVAAACAPVARAEAQMGRHVETDGLKELLYRHYESPHWDEVAKRCLACANCTMVCPTCFCTSVEDVTDLTGGRASRQRRWDSCFSVDFSYIHGGSVRGSAGARYRQWLTHKLGTWYDQFGSSGCVGCGRCITWCPVGIDITEEVAALRQREAGGR
ncbi:MAG TPA: 4Fe-4S dicluster domain-containing protein [Vicinamibacteria bacterium]|nr:4Fe-4S dicluster domain-containing protein [Vicinamibacteria bacterium]